MSQLWACRELLERDRRGWSAFHQGEKLANLCGSETLALIYNCLQLFGNIEIVARISIFFTKLSILLLTIRIFVPAQSTKTKIWYASWAVIWFNLLYCIALVLVVILQCVNKKEIPGKTCIDTYSLLVTASIINVLSDLMMLAIPLVAVWDLQMPMRRKIGISVVFAVGML